MFNLKPLDVKFSKQAPQNVIDRSYITKASSLELKAPPSEQKGKSQKHNM